MVVFPRGIAFCNLTDTSINTRAAEKCFKMCGEKVRLFNTVFDDGFSNRIFKNTDLIFSKREENQSLKGIIRSAVHLPGLFDVLKF